MWQHVTQGLTTTRGFIFYKQALWTTSVGKTADE